MYSNELIDMFQEPFSEGSICQDVIDLKLVADEIIDNLESTHSMIEISCTTEED